MLASDETEQLDRIGAIKLGQSLAAEELGRLRRWADGFDLERPGNRIDDPSELQWLLQEGFIASGAKSLAGSTARAVRILLFNKTPSTNWTLGWHQDRTIAVKRRLDVPGFDPWTVKAGVPHVEPPFGYIERMVTVRIHLDEVDKDNAPLLIAPGSHRLGRITEDGIADVVDRCRKVTCLAHQGDVWLYRTPILHASKRSVGRRSRRVLQADFSADDLPGGLEWWMA